MSKEGFYKLEFAGASGVGIGVIVLDTNMVVGCDVGGVVYDGSYERNERTDQLDLKLTLTVPPGMGLVTGVPARDKAHSFWVRTSIPRDFEGTQIFDADTQFGPVRFRIAKIRDFPN
ncbi:MAG TPA: hypothetical protein VED46_13310 [Alphaproteobacteria bacterium]|nr:hypothetical protein [Alphaproteobacteria bacterium]